MWKPTRMILGTTIVLFVRSLVYEVEKVKGTPALLRLFSSILEFVGARAATSIVCMTESMRESFASFSRQDPHTIAVLPNDVPPKPTFSRRSETGTTTIVTSGVLDSRKNVSLLLDAFSILPTPGPAVTLHIVGDGPLAPRLKARTHELHLNDQVTFTGWVPSLTEEYERASLVVHPSLHEGMPNSIMEAFASDVPVLAADTPELRELLLFDELLFDPHDPHSLASKLSAFVRSSEHRALISLLCSKRAVVYSFDWNARAAELVCA